MPTRVLALLQPCTHSTSLRYSGTARIGSLYPLKSAVYTLVVVLRYFSQVPAVGRVPA